MMNKQRIEQWLNNQWYGPNSSSVWRVLACPLSSLFKSLSQKDSAKKKRIAEAWQRPNIPIIVVGNVTVGGSGKTPVVIALVEYLQKRGLNPGVISRGYGANRDVFPHLVTKHDKAIEVGDEPRLIVDRTQVPLVIDPNRQQGVNYLIEQAETKLDVIISDDGLQHYQLPRDIEIVVVDGKRGFGNQQLLPLGPLREPLARLDTVDFILLNGSASLNGYQPVGQFTEMQLKPSELKPIKPDAKNQTFAMTSAQKVHAVSGIGNPDRFFETLRGLSFNTQDGFITQDGFNTKEGFDLIEHRFADHHGYQASDFHFLKSQSYPIVMTEKDAVKCRDLDLDGDVFDNAWYLPVTAQFPDHFWQQLDAKLIDTKLNVLS